MIDLVVRGGTVVTPSGAGALDVAVEGEKIVSITEPGALNAEGARVIDATGKIVVPGGIEPHAHVATPIFGQPDAETAPPDQTSRAALFGGVTTVTDFAVTGPRGSLSGAVEERNNRWKGNAFCDYSYHAMFFGDIPSSMIAEVPEVIQSGLPTLKVFTTDVTDRPEVKGAMMGLGRIHALMELAAQHDALVLVHGEDDDLVQYGHERLVEEGRTEFHHVHEVHSNMSEDISFRRILRAAEWAGAGVYMVHVSAREGVEAIREARAKGLPAYGETLHNYISFTQEDYQRPEGQKYHTYPSLKSEEDRQALWDGLLNGGLSTTATDEYCMDRAMKLAGETIHDVAGGHNGIETRMGIIYTEGVAKRGMSLERFVDVTSANAARLLGYYPRKGALAPGSDADIVVIDPAVRKPLSMADLHIGDYSIWEGWPIEGWPAVTILRGKVVVENGRFFGERTDGRFIPRKIDGAVLSRPVC